MVTLKFLKFLKEPVNKYNLFHLKPEWVFINQYYNDLENSTSLANIYHHDNILGFVITELNAKGIDKTTINKVKPSTLIDLYNGYAAFFYPNEKRWLNSTKERNSMYWMDYERSNSSLKLFATLTWAQLVSFFDRWNEAFDPEDSPIMGIVCYRQSNFRDTYYPEDSRTYCFSSNNKAFKPGMGGYSIFASSLDGTDRGVRIEHISWKVDYCYIPNYYNLKQKLEDYEKDQSRKG